MVCHNCQAANAKRFGKDRNGNQRYRCRTCRKTFSERCARPLEYNLGERADYAMLVKEYGQEGGEEARRYAPPRLIGAEKISISGNPDEARICTSHVERTNWTLRGHLRRMTRLSNGFSRKRANLRAALALFFAYYNLCRMHKSIRMTPAMAAGITRKPWTMAELLAAAQGAA